MNQTPQMPPNEPEPLDASEREIARMLRSLPSGSPSPELDARILGAARRAVHQQPKQRPLSWWRSIGIGAAASAVLAAGLLVKMHGYGSDMGAPSGSAQPAAAEVEPEAVRIQPGSVPANAVPTTAHAIAPVSPPTDMPAPATVPPRADMAPVAGPAVAPSPSQPARMQAQSAEAGAAAAQPVANAFPTEEKAERSNPSPAGNLPAASASGMAARQVAPAPVPPPAPPAPPALADQHLTGQVDGFAGKPQDTKNEITAAKTSRDELDKDASQARKKAAPAAGGATSAFGATKSKELDRVEVRGSSLRRDDEEPATATTLSSDDQESADASTPLSRDDITIDDEARLAPAQWLDRIRQHLRSGNDALARASLRRFHTRYPDAAIPDDLRPALR